MSLPITPFPCVVTARLPLAMLGKPGDLGPMPQPPYPCVVTAVLGSVPTASVHTSAGVSSGGVSSPEPELQVSLLYGRELG